MLSSTVKSRSYYSTAFLLVLVGLGFIIWQERFSTLLLVVTGLFMFLQLLFVEIRKEQKASLLRVLFRLLIALMLVAAPVVPMRILLLAIAVYQLVFGIFLLIHSLILWRNQLAGALVYGGDSLLHFLFSGAMLFDWGIFPFDGYWLLGVYIIFLGVTSFRDGLEFDFGKHQVRLRKKRVSLPIILTALIPIGTLNRVNDYLDKDRSSSHYLGDRNQPVDLEIWVHTARQGFEMMGHVDISFQGQTYAYGNYDVESGRLFGTIGDGILFSLPTEQYKESIAAEEWRAVFGYGLLLTDAEKQAIQEKLHQLLKVTKPFKVRTDKQKASYLGKMMRDYGATAYTFTSGKYKTYFVMTTNCVQLIDGLVGDTGMDILDNHGILTPGAYQSYLEKEFSNPNSRVVTKMTLGKRAD